MGVVTLQVSLFLIGRGLGAGTAALTWKLIRTDRHMLMHTQTQAPVGCLHSRSLQGLP